MALEAHESGALTARLPPLRPRRSRRQSAPIGNIYAFPYSTPARSHASLRLPPTTPRARSVPLRLRVRRSVHANNHTSNCWNQVANVNCTVKEINPLKCASCGEANHCALAQSTNDCSCKHIQIPMLNPIQIRPTHIGEACICRHAQKRRCNKIRKRPVPAMSRGGMWRRGRCPLCDQCIGHPCGRERGQSIAIAPAPPSPLFGVGQAALSPGRKHGLRLARPKGGAVRK
jgi:hypothetical protein